MPFSSAQVSRVLVVVVPTAIIGRPAFFAVLRRSAVSFVSSNDS